MLGGLEQKGLICRPSTFFVKQHGGDDLTWKWSIVNPPTMQPSLKRYAAVKITEKPRLHHHKDFMASVYSCFEKGCPTEKQKLTRQYRKAWWVMVVYCCIVKFTSFQRVGRRRYEYVLACVNRNKMDFELLTCLLKFIEHFPDYLSVLSRMLLRFSWTTFVETAVYPSSKLSVSL